ncbi:IclR family transcriptional regulator [Rhodococcus sp. O3]|uniref:IclR family transcriptional regulator n=1 Tax=Rhodococcus sp. O3 TaxID=3404919 RepID=UPI003B679E98
MQSSNRAESPIAMVDRIMSVLEAFADGESLTLAQVSRRTGVPRSSVHRLLTRLSELGALERTGFEYRVGIRLFDIGSHALDKDAVHRVALPYMNRLARATGASVYLATLSGSDIVYTEGIWTDWAGPRRPGITHPAHLTAAGRMLLACLPEDELTDHLPGDPRSLRTKPGSVADLREELRQVRQRGVCVSRGSIVRDSVAYAVQIGPPDYATTALSVWGPTDQMRSTEIVSLLRQTGRAIWDAAQRGAGAGRPPQGWRGSARPTGEKDDLRVSPAYAAVGL